MAAENSSFAKGIFSPRDVRRGEEPVDVLGEAEDGRAVRGLVAADPLEDPEPVVQRVGEHVDGRVLPVHELAVHPDLRGLLEHRRSPSALPHVGERVVGAILGKGRGAVNRAGAAGRLLFHRLGGTSNVRQMTQEQVEATGDQLQVVVFAVEGKVLGVDILKVQEILRMVEITPFPRMPPFALGAINVRGLIVPIINLRHKLGLPDRPPGAHLHHARALGRADHRLPRRRGLRGSRFAGGPPRDPRAGPGLDAVRLFSGLGKLPGRLLVIINPDRLLSPQEERLLPSPRPRAAAAKRGNRHEDNGDVDR